MDNSTALNGLTFDKRPILDEYFGPIIPAPYDMQPSTAKGDPVRTYHCPACGRYEFNQYSLELNHGYDPTIRPDNPRNYSGGECLRRIERRSTILRTELDDRTEADKAIEQLQTTAPAAPAPASTNDDAPATIDQANTLLATMEAEFLNMLAEISSEVATLNAPVLERLHMIHAMRTNAESVEVHIVAQAIAAGRSWTEIGHALGMTKQAAHKKYADHWVVKAEAANVKGARHRRTS